MMTTPLPPAPPPLPSAQSTATAAARRHPLRALTRGLASQDVTDNELVYFESIHLFVELLDQFFGNVCELDIMFNLEKAHFILNEMVMNGHIIETNKANALRPVVMMEKACK